MTEAVRRLTVAAYVVALYFVLSFLVDVPTNVMPFNFSSETWRYGVVATVSNYLVSVLFGLILAAYVAALNGHRLVLRAVSILSAIGAVVLTVLLIGFLLDYIQTVRLVNAEDVRLFRIGAGKAGMKIGFVDLALTVMAVGAWRAAKVMAPRAEREEVTLVR